MLPLVVSAGVVVPHEAVEPLVLPTGVVLPLVSTTGALSAGAVLPLVSTTGVLSAGAVLPLVSATGVVLPLVLCCRKTFWSACELSSA